VARFADKVEKLLGDAATTQGEFDAMVSLTYNIGVGSADPKKPGGFTRSSVLRLHKAGDKAGAAAAFQMWNKQAGKVLNGLTIRRAAEAALYRGAETAADLAARLKREDGL
jgi:lysozyme